MKLDHDEIATLWVQEGGRRGAADMAASIALAESTGDTGATNTNSDGTVDRGLFQINSSNGPLSTYTLSKNIKAAILLSANGTTWRKWCTAWSDDACGKHGGTYEGDGSSYKKFITGSYTPQDIRIRSTSDGGEVVTNSKGQNLGVIQSKSQGLDQGEAVPQGITGGLATGLVEGSIGWAKGLAALLGHLLNGSFWKRVGQGAAGLLLMLIGAGLMFRNEATALIPTARVASAMKGATS